MYFPLFFSLFWASLLFACSSVPPQTEICFCVALFSSGSVLEHPLRQKGIQKAMEKLSDLEIVQHNSSAQPQEQLEQLQQFFL